MTQARFLATRWILLAYCVLFGVLCGAGLFQNIVVVPGWTSGEEIIRSYRYGYGFFPFVTPPLTLIGIVLAFVGWWSPQPMKRWLYLSVVPFLLLVVLTFAYYLPVLVSLETDPRSAMEFASAKERWAQLDLVRQLSAPLMVAAGIHAYGLSYRTND